MAPGESDPAQFSPTSAEGVPGGLSDEVLLRLLGRDLLASKGLTRLEYNSQLLGYSAQHLILWALTGGEPSLQAFQRLVELFPSGAYRVRYSAAQLEQLQTELADVSYQLEGTRTEALANLGRLEASLLDLDHSLKSREDVLAQLAAYRAVIAQLEARLRAWRVELPRLPIQRALPSA